MVLSDPRLAVTERRAGAAGGNSPKVRLRRGGGRELPETRAATDDRVSCVHSGVCLPPLLSPSLLPLCEHLVNVPPGQAGSWLMSRPAFPRVGRPTLNTQAHRAQRPGTGRGMDVAPCSSPGCSKTAGSGGWWSFTFVLAGAAAREKPNTRGGTRTRNLLLRREAPYPLGHTSSCHRLPQQS